MSHPGGAPTKYRPGMCVDVQEKFAEGWSVAEVCAMWGVAKSSYYLWIEEHKEFSDAVQRAKALGEAWWTRTSRENLENREFNTPLWKSNMANRFGWRDNKDVKESADNKLHITIEHV